MKKTILLLILLIISFNTKSQVKNNVLKLGKNLFEYSDSFYAWYNVFKNDDDEIGALCGLLGGSYALCLAIGSTSLYEDNSILKSLRNKAELEHYLKDHNIDPQEFYRTVYESKSIIIQTCETYTGTNICKPKPDNKIVPNNEYDKALDALNKVVDDELKRRAEQNKKDEEKKQQFLDQYNSITYICTCNKCGNKWECQGTKKDGCCVSCSKCGYHN